jgi:hypothetical protein
MRGPEFLSHVAILLTSLQVTICEYHPFPTRDISRSDRVDISEHEGFLEDTHDPWNARNTSVYVFLRDPSNNNRQKKVEVHYRSWGVLTKCQGYLQLSVSFHDGNEPFLLSNAD